MPWWSCRAGGPFERVSVADGRRPGKAGSRRIRVVGGVPLGRLRRRVARADGRIEGKYEPAPWRPRERGEFRTTVVRKSPRARGWPSGQGGWAEFHKTVLWNSGHPPRGAVPSTCEATLPSPWRSGGSGSAATSERNASTSVPKMHDAITDVAG